MDSLHYSLQGTRLNIETGAQHKLVCAFAWA